MINAGAARPTSRAQQTRSGPHIPNKSTAIWIGRYLTTSNHALKRRMKWASALFVRVVAHRVVGSRPDFSGGLVVRIKPLVDDFLDPAIFAHCKNLQPFRACLASEHPVIGKARLNALNP